MFNLKNVFNFVIYQAENPKIKKGLEVLHIPIYTYFAFWSYAINSTKDLFEGDKNTILKSRFL